MERVQVDKWKGENKKKVTSHSKDQELGISLKQKHTILKQTVIY